MLSALLADRRQWKQKRALRLPINGPMFTAMQRMVTHSTHTQPRLQHSDRASALFDWIGLGAFTGHRLNEFGQSTLPAGSKADSFDPLPGNNDIPAVWRGKPKAFVRDDFVFYDAQLRRLDHTRLTTESDNAEYVHIRWRFDKSKDNFITKQYRRQHKTALCPVKRAASIVLRAIQLQLPTVDAPLGLFIGDNGQRYTIRGPHVQAFLREACTLAYPDPNHYYRINIHLLQAHSIRITACVVLDNAGVPHNDIKFRLRWNSDAMNRYLRDGPRHIGDLTASALNGINAYADITPTEAPAPGVVTTDRTLVTLT
jgi:hypothetical protein